MPGSGMGGVIERCDLVLVALGALFLGEIDQAIHRNRVHGLQSGGGDAWPSGGRFRTEGSL